ncbi:cell wall hydrolase SleB [Rhizobium sp. PDO1-076]|uniref:cell wall hydrolase n=1 Tax=Rhizobium sp. PDO1-076 TaxID=1125979 RepID=UPI00024E39EF|nr:cell wall hydrolase [Rhizobium sp. PDO1-076]EHS48894.1 cell wall hydrolase SleB [Rhizobium sp. PDO1-076]
MEQVYVVVASGQKRRARLYQEPSTDSALVNVLSIDDTIYLDLSSDQNVSAPKGWRHVTYRPTPGAVGNSGWIEIGHVGPLKTLDVPPVDEDVFVKHCARTEIQAHASETDGAPAILADYLIALAWIESELTKFGNRLPGTSAIGPFQITEEEWADFVAANPAAGYGPFQRFNPLSQVTAAQFLTQRDWEALEAEAVAADIAEPEQSFIPSFLLLLQARLVGAKAAFAIDRMHVEGNAQTPVADALAPFYPAPGDREALISRRRRFLQQGLAGHATTVDEFVEKTAAVLNEAFQVGFSKLKQHFPEFAIPPVSAVAGGMPWVAIAQTEETFWARADVSETTPAGKTRVKDYFNATSYRPPTVEPWCGAFVAWCLSQAGASVVEQAATAKSWKTWGSVELRKGGLTDPKVQAALEGAVVVLHPGKDTGTTGHVCFALSRMESSRKLTCIGGNQGDTVRTEAFDLSRVASIRALTPVDMPTGDEQLILARTIYGEARSESEMGREAVAEVILNRKASPRYPDSIIAVCLQHRQFSCWNARDPNRAKIIHLQPGADRDFDECLVVAGEALAGKINHLTDAVLHYHSTSIGSPDWVRKSPRAFMERKIGRHLFYRGIA